MTIMTRLRLLLEERNIRNNELAKKIGVPQSTFQTWISRNEDFPARYVVPICRELDISPEFLLDGVERDDDQADAAQLSEQELTLLEFVRSLDKEGMIVVTNKAVEEMRRVRATQGSGSDARVG